LNSESTHNDTVRHFRQALEQDAFAPYCQPIAALGGLVRAYPMAEVLIRMREEESALLPPGDFFPVLQHHGLLPLLDRWMVRQVLRRAAIGSRIPRFAVNLSAQTLADRAFPAFIADELAAARLPGNCLLFEIEESDAIALPDCTARFAAMAVSLGAEVVLDGFGRTPESLSLIEAPCVRMVKLHASLTRRLLCEDLPSEEVARAVDEPVARGMRIIAECVEDPGAFGRLKELGIDYAQGFGVYRPQPIDAFTEPHRLLAA
jgi:EAL domain-containing protein (putative c-di-GMP-specific phosphodiesterase class I)